MLPIGKNAEEPWCKLIEFYRTQLIDQRTNFVRLCLRNSQSDPAVETLKDWRFLKRLVNFPTYSIDTLNEMLSWLVDEK